MNSRVLKKIASAIEQIGTQEEVAEIFGVTQPTISKWKRNGVSVAKTVFFCNILNARLDNIGLTASDIHPDVFL